MNGIDKPATITGYQKLYGSGYFAHAPNASSFDQDGLPSAIIRYCRGGQYSGIIDVGAGNGLLGCLMREAGFKCLDVDVTCRSDDNFVHCDFSSHDAGAISRINRWSLEECDSGALVTSFDMAEHVDPEHISNFVYNLSEITKSDALISVSTRPSSRANIYHSTILPIDSWKYFFSLVGLEAEEASDMQDLRSNRQFRSDTQELLAVSSWQKRNPFEDHESHQHYLRLRRTRPLGPSREDVRNNINKVLGISHRFIKRAGVPARLPRLFYLVSFIQDWSFLRSFLDVWPSAKVFVIIRRDSLVPAYADLIEAYLTRVDVDFASVTSLRAATSALARWDGRKGDLFLTATEGMPTLLHSLASRVTLEARRRKMTTATFQHGAIVYHQTCHAAQFFIAMDAPSCTAFERSSGAAGACTALNLGAPKRIDATLARSDVNPIPFRLRSLAQHYRQRILVATNLHWLAHDQEGAASIAKWLVTAAKRYPGVFFMVRPHPDDWRFFETSLLLSLPNVLTLDEITLLCLDWPLSGILATVDGVVSTHSTMVGDALAADKPTAIIPSGISDQRLLDEERRWNLAGATSLSAEQCQRGELPEQWLAEGVIAGHAPERGDYGEFLSNLVALIEEEDSPEALSAAMEEVNSAFLESSSDLCLDSHPHSYRQAMSAALERFVTSP